VGGLTAPVGLMSGGYAWTHKLTLIHRTTTGTPDDYNQPTEGAVVETPFVGRLVENSAVKIQQANAAGVTIGSHFLKAPAALAATKNDLIRWTTDDGRRYEISNHPHLAEGRLHHQIIDLKEVQG